MTEPSSTIPVHHDTSGDRPVEPHVIDLRDPRPGPDPEGLVRDLHLALESGQLRTAYQPIVDALHGTVLGVEALLRWIHPEHGNLPPDTVVPLAEEAGLIDRVGAFVLERACRDAASWCGSDGEPLAVSVNVSAHQVADGDMVVATAEDVFDRTGFSPERITLELTESALLHDQDGAAHVLGGLKAMGVRVALDDFGTGYSSLSYLKQLPVDVVKIDRMFVTDLDGDPSSQLIVGAVVDLAHGMGMTVVAEGIETAAQHRAVLDPGCDACQGFHFSGPLWADELGRRLDAGTAVRSRR